MLYFFYRSQEWPGNDLNPVQSHCRIAFRS